MRGNITLLTFSQKLPFIDTNLYFLLKPIAAIDDDSNKLAFSPMLKSGLIYHVSHTFGIYHLYISISVIPEIIVIAYDKGYPDFAQCYKILSWS